MKKIFIITLMLLSTLFCSTAKSQNSFIETLKNSERSIGFQVNPFFTSVSSVEKINELSIVYAVRYGINFYKGLTVGPEVSGMYSKSSYNLDGYQGGYSLGLGLYSRYTFLKEKTLKPICELGVAYEFIRSKKDDKWQRLKSNEKFKMYLAGGVGINLYKQMATLDLMLKFTSNKNATYNHFVPTYKFTIYF